jgi:hypothetical protein
MVGGGAKSCDVKGKSKEHRLFDWDRLNSPLTRTVVQKTRKTRKLSKISHIALFSSHCRKDSALQRENI